MRYLIIILLLASCAPKIINTKTTTVRDSIVTKTVHHRDTIKIPGQTIFVTKTIKDTTSFTIDKKEGRGELIITDNHGQLSAKCECDSIRRAFDFVSKDTSRYKFKTTTLTRTIEVKFIPKFYKFTFGFFWIIIAIILGGTIYRFRKLLPAPFNLIP